MPHLSACSEFGIPCYEGNYIYIIMHALFTLHCLTTRSKWRAEEEPACC